MYPHSIGIIPDGNRRLAARLMEKPWKGHEWGIEKVYTVMDWCRELGIKNVIFYALSLENLEKRPRDELRFLFALAKNEMERILTDPQHQIHRHSTKVTFFGRLDLLPQDLQDRIVQVQERTKDYQDRVLQIAMAYGGRQEIITATKTLVQKVQSGELKEITEDAFAHHLQTNGYGDPDLILRTGGEKRLSNFLPFQSVYAELAFVDTFWPELTKEQFMKTMQDFASRDRRYGQ